MRLVLARSYLVFIAVNILINRCWAVILLHFQSGKTLSSVEFEKLLNSGYRVGEILSSISFRNSDSRIDYVPVRPLVVHHSIIKQYFSNFTLPCIYYCSNLRLIGSISFCNEKFQFHPQTFSGEREPTHNRWKRNALKNSPVKTKGLTLELYLVADSSLVFREQDDAMERLLLIAAHTAALLHPLEIELVVVGGEVWNDDPFPMNQSSHTVLQDFQRYRLHNITVRNDHAQLFTTNELADGRIGSTLSQSICSNKLGAGITVDHYQDVWVTAAVTLAHELGHSLGLEHDDREGIPEGECLCIEAENQDYCIMHSQSSQAEQPSYFSNCSKSQLKENLKLGLNTCLLDKPMNIINNPSCGNYILDEDEECDCGIVKDCTSECCDPSTCKLVPSAQCYQGSCCDVETCKLLPAATECRSMNNYCDLPEFCTGVNSTCPDDFFLIDGTVCNNDTAYCYGGECRTHTDQCKYVWGDDSTKSIDACYNYWNRQGKYYGNCGYSLTSQGDLIYIECNEEDTMCGLLQCTSLKIQPDPRLKLLSQVLFHNQYIIDGALEQCNIVIYNTNTVDPGLVSNGVKCGSSKYCINQSCVSLSLIPDYCNCTDHGVCNNKRHCHCNVGFDPVSNCSQPGSGGSKDSGPATPYVPKEYENHEMEDDNSLTIGLCVLFLVIIPLIATGIVIFVKRDLVKDRCMQNALVSRMNRYVVNR